MTKINSKKMLTVMIALAMIFSALAVISFAAQPAYAAASGTVTYNPTTFGVTSTSPTNGAVTTVAFVSGGTFSSGATVYFYLSTTDSATGLALGGYAIGATVLGSSSPTSLDQAVTFFPATATFSGVDTAGTVVTPGTYDILASQVTPPTTTAGLTTGTGSFAFPAAATQFVVQTASLTILNALNDGAAIGSNALTVGGTGIAYGTGFDSGASVNFYLSYPGGTTLTTGTANSFGTVEATFTVPALSGTVNSTLATTVFTTATPYTVVAEEMNSYSASTFPQGGITADSSMDIAPTLTVSPVDIAGTSGTSLTLTGTGFPAGGVAAASSSSSPSTSIQIETLGSALASGTYHSAATVSSSGQFSVTVTTASSLTSYTGPLAILITLSDTSPYKTTIYEYFSPALYVSIPNPQSPGFFFEPSKVLGSYYPVVSPLTAAVYDFPASALVSIYLGSTLIGNVTTDSNGFGQLPVTAALPAIPAGTYSATAVDVSSHLVALPTTGVTSSISVLSFFAAADPAGNSLYTSGYLASIEYVPQNGTIAVSAYGLAPGTLYSPVDSVIGNIVSYGTNVTVAVGSVYSSTALLAASNGTLIFSYQPFYGFYGITTSTSETITLGAVTTLGEPSHSASTVGFLEIGAPSVSLAVYQTSSGSSISVTFGNVISSPTPASFYPGTSGYYNLYIGTSKIISSGSSVFTASNSPVSFTVPSLASGLYNISITYSGQSLSMALPVADTESAMVVVSTAGTSTSSGGITTVATYSSGVFSGYVIAGYGLIASTSYDLIIYSSAGSTSVSGTTSSSGSFFDSSNLAAIGAIYTGSTAGTYGIVLSVGTGTAMYEFYSSYVVYPTLGFTSTGGSYFGTPVFYDFMNDKVTLAPTGLSSGTYYDLYFGSMYVETVKATSVSAVTPNSFYVPVVPAGLYMVNLTYTGTSTVVVSEPFYVLPSYDGTMTVSSAQGLPTEYAFPGQIIDFTWTPTAVPNAPGTVVVNSPTVGSFTYGTVYVTVYLNNTAYTTLPATYSAGTLLGSFLAPNAAIGSYWNVSLSWTQNVYTSSSPLILGSPLSGATTQNMYSMVPVHDSYLGLVQGNGALLTAISQTEIATIEAELTNAVKTSLQVPLSELSANITALHGDIVTITTSFGTMTTTLQTINATVGSISSGVVLLQTDIGSMKTSLASLNATIISLNGSLATLSTSLGKIQTTTSALNATVTSVNNGIATVQTSLGTLTGTVTAMNSTVAQVHTTLGTLNANVSAIKTSTSGFTTLEIFLIVAIVLILITLVMAFLAVSSSNKLARKIEEQKKQ